MTDKKQILVFGLGYVGTALARSMAEDGWQIIGTTRNPDTHAMAGQPGWRLLPFDSTGPIDGLADYLAESSAILSTIAPQDQRDPVLHYHREEIARFTGWSGYISATSVYADQTDEWVDETTPTAPATKRGQVRVETEADWQQTLSAEILRVAGIYGPGRSAFTALRAGTARIIDKPDHFFNRIHLDDIVAVIRGAMARPSPGRIVNVTDKEPAKQGDVVRFAADLLGVAPPPTIPFEEAEMSEMARSFYRSRRRLRSVRIESELGVQLSYPNDRQGLKAVFAADEAALKHTKNPQTS